jgi:hypothetical protein
VSLSYISPSTIQRASLMIEPKSVFENIQRTSGNVGRPCVEAALSFCKHIRPSQGSSMSSELHGFPLSNRNVCDFVEIEIKTGSNKPWLCGK